MRVKFNQAGRWSECPTKPQFDVVADEIKDISAALAEFVINSQQGVLVMETGESKVVKETTEAPKPKKRGPGRPRKQKEV
jgi:hypothetical protein